MIGGWGKREHSYFGALFILMGRIMDQRDEDLQLS